LSNSVSVYTLSFVMLQALAKVCLVLLRVQPVVLLTLLPPPLKASDGNVSVVCVVLHSLLPRMQQFFLEYFRSFSALKLDFIFLCGLL
jgi:hypothetical protein